MDNAGKRIKILLDGEEIEAHYVTDFSFSAGGGDFGSRREAVEYLHPLYAAMVTVANVAMSRDPEFWEADRD